MLPFHERDGWIWYNGEMVRWQDAKLHVLTHGLHYASAVFEGERAYNGTIFKLTEHTQRLHDSAEILDFKIPYSVAALDEASRQTLKANKLTDGYVRPIAWRGSEMMGVSAQKNRINVAIAAWEWPSYFSPEARMEGIRLAWAKYRRPDPATAPSKSKAAGLYMICTISKHTAERDGYADAMMLDWRGYKIVERHIKPEELAKTQEVFICGTAAEVTPIQSIGDQKFKPGEITRSLMQDYDALVRGQGKASAKAAE